MPDHRPRSNAMGEQPLSPDERTLPQPGPVPNQDRGSLATEFHGIVETDILGDATAGQAVADKPRPSEDLDDKLRGLLTPPQAPDEIGRLGPYRVIKVLGAGGMGVVFRAEDPHLGRFIALKAMLPSLASSPGAKQRFLREARAAAALKHDHVVTIHQVGEDRGAPFLAMEFLEGEPLDVRLAREGKLPLNEVLRIGREMAEGLEAAHECDLMHRDIKPANVWLERKRCRVKILDFGLARAASEDTQLTQQGAIVGTPAFMAPEQAQGRQLDHRCDLFSLGCVMYYMSTGELPFKGKDIISTLMAVATIDPPPPKNLNPDVPQALSDLIMQLLAKRPDERPATAQAVVDAIHIFEREAATPKATQHPRPRRPRDRRMAWAVAAGGAVLLLLLGVMIYVVTNKGTIKLDVRDKDVVVRVDGQVVTVEQLGKPITLRAGEHEMRITRGDTEIEGPRTFTVYRGENPALVVGFDAKTPLPPRDAALPRRNIDSQRQAAQWVLSIGGKVTVRVGDREIVISTSKDLPVGGFSLVAITLNENQQVSDAGLETLKGLADLRELWLGNTAVSDAGLENVSGLTNLNVLELGGTRVSDAGLENIRGLTNLTRIGLTGTAVSGPGLKHLRGLSKLMLLHLSNSGVSDVGLEHLEGLTNLVELQLDGTEVGDAGLAHLQALKKLGSLGLESTQTSDAGLAHLKDLTDLGYLGLNGTHVSDVGLEHLKGCIKLSSLGLSGTQVSDAGLEHLRHLTNLVQLDLDETQVSDAGLERLRDLTNLGELELNGTRIGDPGLVHLRLFAKLRGLWLVGTQVSDSGLEHLKGLTALTRLDLSNTRVSEAGVAALKAALPNCDVVWSH